MNVLVAGGSGFIGRVLCQLLLDNGFQVSVLTRNPHNYFHSSVGCFYWNVDTQEIDMAAFENVDAIINLAGEGIGNKRWTASQMTNIKNSRINAIKLLLNSVERLAKKPSIFLSSSAIGYYGSRGGSTVFVESDPAGNDFLASVCALWEEEAMKFSQLSLRTCIIRTGIVLSPKDGALKAIIGPLKAGILFRIGNGSQPFPWIHIHDICQIYLFLLKRADAQGVFNAASPQMDTFNDVLSTISLRTSPKPFIITVPKVALKLVLGKMAAILLNGAYVSSQKITDLGYKFKYGSLKSVFYTPL